MRIFPKLILYSAIVLFTAVSSAFGQSLASKSETADTTVRVVILFPFDKAGIDRGFMNNAESLDALHALMSERSELDSIIVTGSSSPEGNPFYNKRLAQQRANSIKNFILENYPDVDRSACSVYAYQGYWDGLIELVGRDPNVPAMDELLKLIKDPGLSDHAKVQRMGTMQNGKTLAYLRNHYILRRLRQGSVVITFRLTAHESQPEPKPELEPDSELKPGPKPEQELKPEPEPELESGVKSEQEVGPELELQPEPMPDFAPQVQAAVSRDRISLALRTNLLLDLLGGANIGLEIPIGNHFSAAGDFVYAYTRIQNRYALQTIQGSLEARYWFKPRRNVLTGWNLGIYGTYCSRFDIQFGGGYQGEGYWSCGLTGGYSVPIAKRLNLDLSVAGGFLYSPEIRKYSKPQDGHLIWEKTIYNASRIALTQVRVNLVWLINTKGKR